MTLRRPGRLSDRTGHPGDGALDAALAAARDGDEVAFGQVYRTVQPLLLRYLRVLVGADAEDVAAEAWVQIVRDLQKFTGDADAFRGWTATIARNRALDHLRRAGCRPRTSAVAVEELHDLAAPDAVDEAVLARIGTDRAIALLATLPPDQAEAVVLRAVVGLDAAAAAKVLGKRPGAVRTAAHRGLARLAETLAATGRGTDVAPGQDVGVTESEPPALKGVR